MMLQSISVLAMLSFPMQTPAQLSLMVVGKKPSFVQGIKTSRHFESTYKQARSENKKYQNHRRPSRIRSSTLQASSSMPDRPWLITASCWSCKRAASITGPVSVLRWLLMRCSGFISIMASVHASAVLLMSGESSATSVTELARRDMLVLLETDAGRFDGR